MYKELLELNEKIWINTTQVKTQEWQITMWKDVQILVIMKM